MGMKMYAVDLYRALLITTHQIVSIYHGKNEVDVNPDTYVIPKCNHDTVSFSIMSK